MRIEAEAMSSLHRGSQSHVGQVYRSEATMSAREACHPGRRPATTLPSMSARLVAGLLKPVLHVRGPVESFRCDPRSYQWLLDHPDRAVKAWLRLGAKCMMIDDRGNGRFGCKDKDGSDVHWDTVVSGPEKRVWYAE